MKKSLFIVALGAFALTSCSQDEVLDVQKDAVQFSVVADKASRGAVTTTATIDNFTVTAFNVETTGGGDKVNGTTFMNLNKVELKDGKWVPGITKFWPTEGAINFYSYSPSDLTGVSVAAAAQTITHTVPTTCGNQIDILYALNTGLGKADGEVPVNFRHALAQIVFQAENSKSDLEVVIDGVRIVNVKNSGTFSWPTASTNTPNYTETENGGTGDAGNDTQLDASWGTWLLQDTYVSHPADITQQILTGETAAAVALTKAADPLLVMPQTFIPATVEDKFMKIEAGKTFFAISCKIYSIENGTTKTLLWPSTDGFAEVVIPATSPDKIDAKDAWKQGRKYVYTFKFGDGAGYIGEGGVTPSTPADPDAPSTDKPANDPSDPNQSGDPVLVPVTFTVTVDQFQTVQEDTDMNTGNTVSDIVTP